MSWGVILQGLLPLVVFFLVDMFAGMTWGVIAAIVFAVAEIGITWWMTGEVDSTTLMASALVIGMGLLSLQLEDPRVFKFQPVILGVLFAAILAYYQWFDTPLMLKLLDRKSVFVPEQMRQMAQHPEVRRRMSLMCGDMIWMFLIHAGMVAYAALNMSTGTWLLVRGAGIYVLMAVLMVFETIRFRL
jgi:intracellular septation protein A